MKIRLAIAILLAPVLAPAGDVTDEPINPIGQHDHYLGAVHVLGTGKKYYPNAAGAKNTFEITWKSAKENVSKEIAAPELGRESVQVYPLKTAPKVTWYMSCPQGDRRCYCSNGRHYSGFTVGSLEASAQNFTAELKTHRLDVNDMEITRQNGSTYFAKGTYTVYVDVLFKDDKIRRCTLLADAATKTGLDVARGFKYEVVTEAVSEEGSTLSSTQEVDLR